MQEAPAENLDEAIGRQAPIVIGCRFAGQVHHLTSRFIGREPTGICIAVPDADQELIASMVTNHSTVAVAFKSNEEKHSFVAAVISQNLSAISAGTAPVQSLLLQRTVDVPSAQRRRDFRVPVSASRLTAKIWRIEHHVYFRDRPLANQKLPHRLIDLSVGGLGVIAEEDAEIAVGQRLRIELKYDDIELLMEGVVRFIARATLVNGMRVGIQFRKLENDVAGRQSIAEITKIVGDIQRTEVRRARDEADAIKSV